MINKKTILITGGYGFLGRCIAEKFKRLDYHIVGVGRGAWSASEASAQGFDVWRDADVSLSTLMTLSEIPDVVVHCAGNGSVAYSLTNPLQDFNKTVQGTMELLEYMRLTKLSALLIYPSSAGVYGAKPDAPIKEIDELNPISPYGCHKRIAEELLASYSRTYGTRVAVIRYFSIYGQGLTKQLLWDASSKLRGSTDGEAVFWGTGEETRDWISSDDAASLVVMVTQTTERFTVLNGASGIRVTVRETLELLRNALGVNTKISFNGVVREGDPRFFHADLCKVHALGWAHSTSLSVGIQNYASWVVKHMEIQRG